MSHIRYNKGDAVKRIAGYKVIRYRNEKGVLPFKKWFLSLKDRKVRYAITRRLDRVLLGNLGDRKPVGGDVYELRVHLSPGYRIYFGIDREIIVVLLYGGLKSSQSRDVLRAKRYWQNYLKMKKLEVPK